MFVVVTYSNTPRVDCFGPSTPRECTAWLRIKGIFPHNEQTYRSATDGLQGKILCAKMIRTPHLISLT